MYQNLLALHSVVACNQEVISVEDIHEITDSLDWLSVGRPQKKSKVAQQPEEEADLEWPRQEEEFLIILDETWWPLGSVQAYDQDKDVVAVQSLAPLKTWAKDDQGRTYWVYPIEEQLKNQEKKHTLEIWPSVSLAKNIKRKDPVFQLLNREIVEAISAQFFNIG